MERSTTSTRKKRNYKEKDKIYATSATGSVAVEDAEESAAVAAAPCGGAKELGAGVKELGLGIEKAAEGVIRDTILGAYSFTFSKNFSIFETGRAREEPIFSQSTSSPCD
jgi:hypothetical protein